MKVKVISSFIWLSLFGITINGQVRQPHSLYFMETIPQISQMNPAFQPRTNGYVSLPANVNVDYRNDLAVKDILQRQGRIWYTPVEEHYDYDLLYKSIGKRATVFSGGLDADIFGFGFRTGKGYFSFGLSEHVSVNTALPSDLFKIPENGLPDNTSLDFSPLRTQSIAYMQVNIGYSHKLNEQLTIGVNVKPLFGQAVVTTKIDQFKMNMDKQQWDFYAKGNFYSSLPVDELSLDENDKINKIEFKDFKNYTNKDWVRQGVGVNNPGIAIDLGLAYQIDERLAVSAALNNLGFISWKNDLNGISFNGKYVFNGLDFDTSEDYDFKKIMSNLGDSILNAMDYKIQHDKFTTMLAPVFHAGATYNLSKSISVGFLSRSVFWQKSIQQSFNLSLNLQPYSFVAFNAGATWQVKSNVFLGSGFSLFIGPLQFYLLVDYIPIFYSTVRIDEGDRRGEKIPYVPEHLKTETVRVGVNLVFGKHGYVNKPMLDKGKSSWN